MSEIINRLPDATSISIPLGGAKRDPEGNPFLLWVDASEFDRFSAHKWRSAITSRGGKVYAATSVSGRTVYAHQMVLPTEERETKGYRSSMARWRGETPLVKKQSVEYINGNTLDCRRVNLRTAGGNSRRLVLLKRSKHRPQSGFKGVNHSSGKKRTWRAMLCVDGRINTVGYFANAVDAARAYDAAAEARFGNDAVTNAKLGLLKPGQASTKV